MYYILIGLPERDYVILSSMFMAVSALCVMLQGSTSEDFSKRLKTKYSTLVSRVEGHHLSPGFVLL